MVDLLAFKVGQDRPTFHSFLSTYFEQKTDDLLFTTDRLTFSLPTDLLFTTDLFLIADIHVLLTADLLLIVDLLLTVAIELMLTPRNRFQLNTKKSTLI